MKATRLVSTENRFVTAVTLFFSAAIGIGLWRHEMWRDEYHAWGLVLNSDSFSQMLSNLRGEGHLPLSYTILYCISRFASSPYAVQFVQLTLAILCAFLFLRFSPFKRWQKVLFLFGYFPLYEYGVISRSYTWDMLGLFGFCAVYGWAKEHQRKPWLCWLFLLMMGANESFGILMGLPLAGLLIADLLAEQEIKKTTRIVAASMVTTCAALLGYILLRVIPLDQWAALTHRFPNTPTDIIISALGVVGRAILPKIHLPRTIWDFPSLKNDFLALQGIEQYVGWFIVAIVLLASVYCFCRLLLVSVRLPLNFYTRKPIFVVWTSGTALLFLFLWSIGGNVDDARHTGHFYLFFITCGWLTTYFPKDEQRRPRWLRQVRNHAKGDLRFLLLAQFVFGSFAYSLDLAYLFSANQLTATHLRSQRLQHAALIAPEAVAIAMGRTAYFPKYDMVASNLIMKDSMRPGYLRKSSDQQIAQRIWRYVRTQCQERDVVVITDTPTTDVTLQKYFSWQSPATLIRNEQYFLYYIPQNAPLIGGH